MSVTLLPTGEGFLEPKAAMAAGLHDRLEQKPERHQEMGATCLILAYSCFS